MERSTIQARIDALEADVLAKKAYLSQTDYKVTKAVEEDANMDAETKAARVAAREQINANEEEIEALRQQLLEPESTNNEE